MSTQITISKFYGATWCADCHRSRKYLEENNVTFDVIDIDTATGAADEVAKINNGYKSIPTIVFSDGSVLVEPSNAELGLKLQL